MERLIMKKKRSRICNSNGFTLIEIMIALVVFAVGILAIATLASVNINSNSKAHTTTENVSFNIGELETHSIMNWYAYSSLVGDYPKEFISDTGVSHTIDADIGTYALDEDGNSVLPVLNTRVVTVTTSFEDNLGKERTTKFKMIKPKQ
ncbi:MAG: prepilin-type N-terminal cleavage/methylation domain-containing protein [Desulfobacteraceae bacterium]|nr:prepilin-type N-terminal cleavage/methylation domain-containing protein [Desulfobacteraceae bacterium]